MTRGDARRRDAPRRAAGVTRTSLSLSLLRSHSPPSLLLSHLYSLSSLSTPISLTPSCSLLRFSLSPSPLHALFDRRLVSLASAIRVSRLSQSIFRRVLLPLRLHRNIYVYVYARVCTYVCVCMHTAHGVHGLELYSLQDPPRIQTCRPQLLHPRATPTLLFWGFHTLSRVATTKPRASTMSDLLSLSLSLSLSRVVRTLRVSRIPTIEKNKRQKERGRISTFLFARTVGLLEKLFTHIRGFASSF